MKKTGIATCLGVGLLLAGCPRADNSVDTAVQPENEVTAPTSDTVAAEPTNAKPDAELEPDVQPEPSVPKPTPAAEEIAAAKELATNLGIAVEEDAEGHVVGIDTANRSWPTSEQMKAILVFPTLESLTLEGPDVTDELTPQIAELTSLTSLALRNTLIGDKGIAHFTTLKSLKVIDLRVSSQVSDASMETLAKLPALRAVRVNHVTNLTDAGITGLLAIPQLTELDIRNCRGITEAGIEQLAKKDTLRTLKVGGPDVDDDVLGVIAGMDKLVNLSLDNCDMTDAGVSGLGKVPLVDLTIYQAPSVTDAGLEVLANYNDLQRLTLRDVPSAKGTALAKLPNPEKLVSLNMSQSGIGDAEVAHLAGMTNLETLSLSETQLTDQAVDALAKLTSLKEMVLTQTSISEEGMNRLRDALPDCSIRSD